ncbi:ArnT family glycosyltransferase [Myxococcota bacterium]
MAAQGHLQSRTSTAWILLAKSAVSALVLFSGFRAISDDDYARVVIAQSFASHPNLDPSGTSWLPLPFWFQGSVMRVFGSSLQVARATSVALGWWSAWAVFGAARALGANPRGALLGALLGSALPYAARLGVATVPDGPVAALLLVGMASTASDRPRHWLGGSLALLAATLSRYEAWPVALGFCVMGLFRATRPMRWPSVALACLPLAGPAAWMIHGLLHHGDAWFFVARVVAYRRALGPSSQALWEHLVRQPFALFRFEPELTAVTLVALILAIHRRNQAELRRYGRPVCLALALLAFLVAGDLRDGTATHHQERSLLSLWLLAAVASGDLLERTWAVIDHQTRRWSAAAATLLVGIATGWARPRVEKQQTFTDRSEEESIGERARVAMNEKTGRLLIDTQDYGYFAVQATFGRPENSVIARTQDPRRPAKASPLSSREALESLLNEQQIRWFITTRQHEAVAQAVGDIVAVTPRLILVHSREQILIPTPPRRRSADR